MTGVFESIAGSKLAAMLGTAMGSDAGKNVLQHVVPSFWNRSADEAAWGTVKSYLTKEQQEALEMLLAPMSKSQRAWLRQVVGHMDVVMTEKPVSIMGADGKEKTVMRQKRSDRRVVWLSSLADRILFASNKEEEVARVLSALEADGHYIADPIGDRIFQKTKEFFENTDLQQKILRAEFVPDTQNFFMKLFGVFGVILVLLLLLLQCQPPAPY